MALPILDGNQSATTLSTILSSGQHIPAHTVVSLGTQAITDMRGAVSGSVVSISNFPATQPVSIASVTIGNTVTIAGTVSMASQVYGESTNRYAIRSAVAFTDGGDLVEVTDTNPLPISGTVTANLDSNSPVIASQVAAGILDYAADLANDPLPIYGTVTIGAGTAQIGSVTVGNSVTIGSLPAISGTVTIGNLPDATIPKDWETIGDQLGAGLNASGLSVDVASIPAISGTVTANVAGQYFDVASGDTAQLTNPVYYDGEIFRVSPSRPLPVALATGYNYGASVTIGNSVTIGSLPAISGTVTANTFAVQGTAVTTSNFTSTTASTVLANYNATRQVLTIFNEGAGNLHICAGATCTTIAYQVRLSAGDYYEVPNHQTTITHSAVFATAGTARVTQVS